MSRFLTVLFLSLFFISTVRADDVLCDESGTQGEMTACAAEAFQKTDKELNRLYTKKLSALETPLTKEHFKKAQQAWIKFRDATCLYEAGAREDSGSIWPMSNLYCMSKITERRVIDLTDYVACTLPEDGCPF